MLLFTASRVKCNLRLKLLAVTLLVLTLTILALVLADKCATYRPLSYLLASLASISNDQQPTPIGSAVGDKIVVIPALVTDDMSWVTTSLPSWQHAIYIVNAPKSPADVSFDISTSTLTTPANKGKESLPYLTYLINHYPDFPSTIAFIHSHEAGFFTAWHTDNPLHSNVHALQLLHLDTVQKNGFVNLRCNLNPGCTRPGRGNQHVTPETWRGVMGNTTTPVFNGEPGRPAALPAPPTTIDDDLEEPSEITVSAPCCAQFAVSREAVLKRPLADYIAMREWLLDTELSDDRSGRVFEFLWHVIFGMEGTFCGEEGQCYCDVYGRGCGEG